LRPQEEIYTCRTLLSLLWTGRMLEFISVSCCRTRWVSVYSRWESRRAFRLGEIEREREKELVYRCDCVTGGTVSRS